MLTRRLLPALTAGVLLTACSSAAAPPSPSATPSSSTASATPTVVRPAVSIRAGDPGMVAALTPLYAGRTIQAVATTGAWKKERVAVVSYGQDVTLLVAPAGSTRWHVVGGWWPSLKKAAQLGKAPRFVVALGSDARGMRPLKGSRTDTIQVVGLDLKGGGGVMGMARDLWVKMPNGRMAKINAAYQVAGGAGTVATIRRVTGIPVEGYVMTQFGGFTRIVDSWGGIPIVLGEAVRGSGAHVNLSAGPHVLTGSQALALARERKSLPDGDFGRSRHQGQILLAVALKARMQGIGALPRDLSIVSQFSETNLSATRVLTFAAALYRVNPTQVGRGVAKGTDATSSDGQAIIMLDAASRAMFVRFRDGRL